MYHSGVEGSVWVWVCVNMCVVGGIWELSVLSTPFCFEPKTVLKSKLYLKHIQTKKDLKILSVGKLIIKLYYIQTRLYCTQWKYKHTYQQE